MQDKKHDLLTRIDRREFLKKTGLAAASLSTVPGLAGLAAAQQTPTADALVAGKDPGLIVRNANPVELETPVALLREHRYTPKNIMYIRNNLGVPPGMQLTTESPKVEEWTLEVVGLVDKPLTLRLSELKGLPATELEMVLQCSGNGRSFFSRYARASGAQWERGAMANVRWKGVKLSAVLEGAGVKPEALFLTAEGADQPANPQAPDIERSVPLRDVLASALLAYEMNGEPLPTVHGGPLRLILPGYYGINNIKWVNRLRLEAAASTNNTMIPRYRVPLAPIPPGSTFTFSLDNSRPNWRQNVKAVILSPLEGQSLSGIVEVRGVAWNDGSAPITGVEVSTNQGRSWQSASLEKPSSPYGWYPWRARVVLARGDGEIWARATDALGRSQPIDGAIMWNPNGYEWNAVDKVKIKVG